ncbi:uncharacterized protein OCT59_015702 [Rhizophagus irregularis]|uniref:Alpha/Beta hydrolase protein n=2 Tax=Rhizophagus irregularis TaxID=588596 RepID=U9TY78_RHIID|nr:Alpha/Beta hydrolase protein [Rhizophagus irregularis DAOM 181602=DAOM 197198]EXX75730.1 hypothetical protein RirG_039400 [Rhizophagus irregularis DAOM 197198w]POG61029.1 Alpha/Beta hydrolase protein [Rhizophagus irregularis DAOM 181602=DAOM 197198]UZO23361.1 hypothetical protein OCT59_015702 [Rhizophagus irregularis]GBC49423.1 alpha/beta hydrolase [Rhizophagus irregularis DAOM 181602=DAOM 197198]|eukprot:XP_025167895.1 Alpha/Beta hydrolase protein [Rhizophagus irregularis DAOM 181602=DAOM 197198]
MRINLSLIYFSIILLIPLASAQFSLECLTEDLPKSVAYTLKTSDGMTISVEERGDISKPTIIFTHGFFSNKLAWEPTFTSPDMSEKYHLVRWDLRGMGDSSKDSDTDKYNDIELYAEDIKLIVDNIKEKKGKGKKDNPKIILVTWSTGSIVSLSYFNITGETNVDGYVSVGNNFISFQNDNVFTEYSKLTIGSIVTSHTYILILDSLNNLIKSFTSPNNQFPQSTMNFFLGSAAYSPSESRSAYGDFNYDYTETFKSLLIPTLNIYGNDDKVVNPVHSQTIANLRPVDGLNHILAYDGVGHVPMWENPKKFEIDLDNWIKDSVLNPKHQKAPKAPKVPTPPQSPPPPPPPQPPQ